MVDDFNDLRRIEDTVEGHIGANSLFALESAILKALAKEKKKESFASAIEVVPFSVVVSDEEEMS